MLALDERRAGCSTPAASASPATATPAPPGWSSTPRSWTARFHRVAYDVATAAETILAAGLPSQLAERLEAGR